MQHLARSERRLLERYYFELKEAAFKPEETEIP